MRIGVECTNLTRPRAGTGFYTYQLLRALAALEGDDEYTLLYNRPIDGLAMPSRLRHSLHGPRSTQAWAQLRLPFICQREKIDVLHSPGQGIPFFYEGRKILTIHDLSPMLFPATKELKSRFVWNCAAPLMAKRCDHVITVSHNTKRDVIDLLGIAEERVTTIYEAAGPEYYPEPDEERLARFRRDKALEPGYILAVGTLEPRKNYPFQFRMFKRWLERSGENATLVIVGKKGWVYDEIFQTFERLGLRKHVRFEGYIQSMDVMRLYYSAAEFCMMTPLYEGFWLPGLESLACGTPVLAPNHSSITEVVGDGGLLVDSWDEEEWLAGMDRLWKAPDRAELSARGAARAAKFSWEQAAKETLEVYRRVGAQS